MIAINDPVCSANELESRPILRQELRGRNTQGRAIWTLEGGTVRQGEFGNQKHGFLTTLLEHLRGTPSLSFLPSQNQPEPPVWWWSWQVTPPHQNTVSSSADGRERFFITRATGYAEWPRSVLGLFTAGSLTLQEPLVLREVNLSIALKKFLGSEISTLGRSLSRIICIVFFSLRCFWWGGGKWERALF